MIEMSEAASIHPTAIVSAKAEIGRGVNVGPYSIIGDGVILRDGVRVASHCVIEGPSEFGSGTVFFPFVSAGQVPHDLKYRGEPSRLIAGERNVFREFTTVHRGTEGGGNLTSIGSDNLFMAQAHVAHDCHIGNNVILSNVVQLAGHVTIEDRAIVSGLSAVHQFVRIGRQSFIGGCSRVSKDIPPFLKAVGNPVKLYGLNTVGLQRGGMEEATIRELKRAYRLLFRSDLNVSQAMEQVQNELESLAEVRELVRFVEASERGVVI